MIIYEFFRNAILAGIFASIICGVMGVYIVLKRIAFISSGIAHATFGGIGVGVLLNINPILTAMMFSVLSAIGIEYASEKTKLHEDTAIGILMSLGMSLGIIFISLSKSYTVDLFGFLFGNILSVSTYDIYLMALLSFTSIATIYLLFKEFVVISFDEEFGRALGIPVSKLKLLFLILVALTIVILIKIVGIILVVALLTLPAATARKFSKKVKDMMLFSVFFGVIAVLLGLVLSYYLNLPSGATIVLISGTIFFVLSIIKDYHF